MATIVTHGIALIIGFIAGALVFRKNAAKMSAIQVSIDKSIVDLKK